MLHFSFSVAKLRAVPGLSRAAARTANLTPISTLSRAKLNLCFQHRNCGVGSTARLEPLIAKSHAEGLLVNRVFDGSEKASLARGSVFEHDGCRWVCVFEIDRYWFASPLEQISTDQKSNCSLPKAQWLNGSMAVGQNSLAEECLSRATPTQAMRAQLSRCLPTGIIAVDVLSPIGVGQSMLMCAPRGTGKTTLATQVMEQSLRGQIVMDKVVRFQAGPSAPPIEIALEGEGSLAQLVATPAAGDEAGESPALLSSLYAAVGAAEVARDAGQHALLVLDTVGPLLNAWDLAVSLVEAAADSPLDPESLATQRRACFAGLFERAANLNQGGSLTMLVLVETDAMAAISAFSNSNGAAVKELASESEEVFALSDFAGRKEGQLERLRRLEARGVKLTAKTLASVGIAPPQKLNAQNADLKAVGGKAAREMQSLSDGQIILDKEAAAKGQFPAIVAGASFSRFGLGSSGATPDAQQVKMARERRDVRAPALQAVAAHLRTLLALEQEARFRPTAEAVDSAQSAQMEAVRAALLQSHSAPLQPEEMTALLLAACSGLFDSLPAEQTTAALSGGGKSPLLLHLQAASPQVLKKIAEEPNLSMDSMKELEVAVRLFVKLQQAGASSI